MGNRQERVRVGEVGGGRGLTVVRSCAEGVTTVYDVAGLDLDGVVYVGAAAVDGAPDALNRAQSDGMHLAFVTNNAARPPQSPSPNPHHPAAQ